MQSPGRTPSPEPAPAAPGGELCPHTTSSSSARGSTCLEQVQPGLPSLMGAPGLLEASSSPPGTVWGLRGPLPSQWVRVLSTDSADQGPATASASSPELCAVPRACPDPSDLCTSFPRPSLALQQPVWGAQERLPQAEPPARPPQPHFQRRSPSGRARRGAEGVSCPPSAGESGYFWPGTRRACSSSFPRKPALAPVPAQPGALEGLRGRGWRLRGRAPSPGSWRGGCGAIVRLSAAELYGFLRDIWEPRRTGFYFITEARGGGSRTPSPTQRESPQVTPRAEISLLPLCKALGS